MTDFEGSRNVKCADCGRPFNTAEGPQCDCGKGEEGKDQLEVEEEQGEE